MLDASEEEDARGNSGMEPTESGGTACGNGVVISFGNNLGSESIHQHGSVAGWATTSSQFPLLHIAPATSDEDRRQLQTHANPLRTAIPRRLGSRNTLHPRATSVRTLAPPSPSSLSSLRNIWGRLSLPTSVQRRIVDSSDLLVLPDPGDENRFGFTTRLPHHLFPVSLDSLKLVTKLEQQEDALAESLLKSFQTHESPDAPDTDQSTLRNVESAVIADPAGAREHNDQVTDRDTLQHPPAAASSPPRQTQQQAHSRMRSSIACVRCRRSKVKCVNNGVGTTCRACENTNRDCTYPPPVAPGSRRRDSVSARPDGGTTAGASGGGGDAERRPRPRKGTYMFSSNLMAGMRESPRPLLDALDSELLTPEVWNDLFDIFQTQFSADLPFLHKPTFLKPLQGVGAAQRLSNALNFASEPKPAARQPRPSASSEFLLAFLALTSRFHPKLVAHHSPSVSKYTSNPLVAAEYYALAAHERLTNVWLCSRIHDIEMTQTCLMLGLHEWGMCRGVKAWLLIGMAIRSAQAMGLQYELDLDDEPFSRSVAMNAEAEQMGVGSNHGRKGSIERSKKPSDQFVQQEIRRRTFWSCFIMDRYLSSGKYRPQMLQARELRIQLPASENSFAFAEKVRTLMLGEDDGNPYSSGRAGVQNKRQASVMLGSGGTPERHMTSSPRSATMTDVDDDRPRLESGADEGLVSRYIKILEIYGKVVKWSCAGGRRKEEYPPWDTRCTFNQLNRQCHDFKLSLPRQHALSPNNTQAHISMKTCTPYILVHTVYHLCQIMLHREYVPFIALRCSKPTGPLDPPLFPPEHYNVPSGFWEESARECFRAAREIMNLVRTCQEWNTLVETPIVGFAIYTVAFVGVYCINFPWMDPDGFMCTKPSAQSANPHPNPSEGFEAARRALEMVGLMKPRLHMANGWFGTINRMHRYFRRLKNDYTKNVQILENSSPEGDSPESNRHLSLREGGSGGGLDEYKLLERTLLDFGNLEDVDVEMADVGHDREAQALDAVYDESSGETTVKSEDLDPRPERPQSNKPEGGSWSAINTVKAGQSNQSKEQDIAAPQFRSYESYPPPQQTPSSTQSTQPHNFPPILSNFRPSSYSMSDTPSAAGPPPSLTSPTSYSATTPSQQSPPYDRSSGYAGWTPQNLQAPMQPPPHPQPNQTSYGNGVARQYPGSASAPQHNAVTSPVPPYPSRPTSAHPTQPFHFPQVQANTAYPQINWNDPMAKDIWFSNIDTRLGGDDVAAFVLGGEFSEWAELAAAGGHESSGWLSNVWNSSNNISNVHENSSEMGGGANGHAPTHGHDNQQNQHPHPHQPSYAHGR